MTGDPATTSGAATDVDLTPRTGPDASGARRPRSRGRGLLVGGAIAAVVGVLVTMSRGGTSLFELGVGDCFVLAALEPEEGSETATLGDVDPIDCAEPHIAEVVATGSLNPDQSRAHPGDEVLLGEVETLCQPLSAGAEAHGFGIVPVIPNEASWEPRGGPYLCIAVAFGGVAHEGGIADRLVTSPLPGV